MAIAIRNVRGYCFIAFAICAAAATVLLFMYFNRDKDWGYEGDFAAIFTIFAFIALIYAILTKILLLKPMLGHEEWIENNGIFSSKAKKETLQSHCSEVNIVQGGKISPYSVADELIKWSKLKDDGHITLEQYNAAKDKLLGSQNV